MLKGSLQTSMNLIKEQSNALIKDFVKQISDLRDTFTNETKGQKEDLSNQPVRGSKFRPF